MIEPASLAAISTGCKTSPGPRVLPWPVAANPGGCIEFRSYAEWQAFFLSLDLAPSVAEVVRAKYRRALKLHLLAWLDFDLIKGGELVAATALELALTDRYLRKATAQRKAKRLAAGRKPPKGDATFAELLTYMVEGDGLTDAQIPLVQRSGGTVVARLLRESHPSLNQIRNELAHGYPFDGLPQAGMLELVRDLINYVYRFETLTPEAQDPAG